MWPRTDIEDEGFLKPWDQEVSAFTNCFINDTTETVEENSALTAIDSVKGGIENSAADAESESGTGDVGEKRNCGLATHVVCNIETERLRFYIRV